MIQSDSQLLPSRSPGLPQVPIVPRAVQRLRAGIPLVLRTDVATEPPSDCEDVLLCDLRGQPIATALWVASGPLAARLWSMTGERFDEETIATRLKAALHRRRPILTGGERDAFRLVHGEADLLPGLFVDCYADAAVIQTATSAMDRRKTEIADLLMQLLPLARVLLRDDGSARDMESLPREKGFLRGGPLRMARFHDAGSTMEADLLFDRKTGSFLDQQENHLEVAKWAESLCGGGEALDAFTYHGGFALALARAGLLDGRTVTTHWEDIADLRARFPELTMKEDCRWVDEGEIVTSGGISAGIDMSLHLVARLAGRELAVATARQMEVEWREG